MKEKAESQKQEETAAVEKHEAAKKDARLVISKEAETAVSDMTDAVNDGFEAGRATRFDVASTMLLWCKNNAAEEMIHEIRRQIADGLSMLDAIQRKARLSGELPPEVKAALETYFFGSAVPAQKKSKKNLKSEYIKDTQEESEAA